MGTLFVDENGERRGFRASRGKLTVGSAPEVKLRLVSQDVAALHADLEILDGDLFVTPMSGVLPPRVQGVEVRTRTRVAPGQELRIGSAVLVWRSEDDGAAPPARPASAAVKPPAGAVATKRPARAGKGRSASGAAGRGGRGGRASAGGRGRRGGSSRSIPAGAIVVGVLALAAVGLWLGLRGLGSQLEAQEGATSFHLRKAEELIEQGNAPAAEPHLAKVPEADLLPADRKRLEAGFAAVEAARVERERLKEEERGDTWFEFKLADYEKRYLGGEPEVPKVRLFLDRCREFRERWPQHPELAWVGRQERRFDGYPGLEEEPALADLEWRVSVLTNARPRDYREAFRQIAEYRAQTLPGESVALEALEAELVGERVEYHEDQLRFARGEYEKGRSDRAVEWLVQSILGLGDEAMANEAAEILVKFENAEGLLLGYERDRPDDWARLKENKVIAAFTR